MPNFLKLSLIKFGYMPVYYKHLNELNDFKFNSDTNTQFIFIIKLMIIKQVITIYLGYLNNIYLFIVTANKIKEFMF